MRKYEWNISKIRNAVKESINFTEVLEKLGIPRQGNNSTTLKRLLIENNIDYSHFTGRARSYITNYVNAETYLENQSTITTSRLKYKLLKEGLIESKCDICGITDWLGKQLTFQLHHIDGNNKNNALDNLQLLCPNCHSQTENYCGSANKRKEVNVCKDCGKEITRGATYCTTCAHTHRRKIKDRPTKDQLLKDFKELKSFVKIGKKYNVSDNSVRKWVKSYDLLTTIKDIKNT